MEGSLRVPFIIRWPDKIPGGRISNEIVHEVDTFTTFAAIAGAAIPADRPIDGVDQTNFLLGQSEASNRDGFPVFVADRLEAVKWRNWKIVFYDDQRDWRRPGVKRRHETYIYYKRSRPEIAFPQATRLSGSGMRSTAAFSTFDLITDPKEEYPATGIRNTWTAGPAMKIVADFEQSVKKDRPIAPGTPDPYTPPGKQMR
jgi:arylsulfatase